MFMSLGQVTWICTVRIAFGNRPPPKWGRKFGLS